MVINTFNIEQKKLKIRPNDANMLYNMMDRMNPISEIKVTHKAVQEKISSTVMIEQLLGKFLWVQVFEKSRVMPLFEKVELPY